VRRILLVLTVTLVMAALMAVSALPALAQGCKEFAHNGIVTTAQEAPEQPFGLLAKEQTPLSDNVEVVQEFYGCGGSSTSA
jgi:hypothetical protein